MSAVGASVSRCLITIVMHRAVELPFVDVVPQLVVGLFFFLPRDAMHKRGFC